MQNFLLFLGTITTWVKITFCAFSFNCARYLSSLFFLRKYISLICIWIGEPFVLCCLNTDDTDVATWQIQKSKIETHSLDTTNKKSKIFSYQTVSTPVFSKFSKKSLTYHPFKILRLLPRTFQNNFHEKPL